MAREFHGDDLEPCPPCPQPKKAKDVNGTIGKKALRELKCSYFHIVHIVLLAFLKALKWPMNISPCKSKSLSCQDQSSMREQLRLEALRSLQRLRKPRFTPHVVACKVGCDFNFQANVVSVEQHDVLLP